MKRLFLDYETFYDPANKYDLKSVSMVEYIRSPLFKAHGLGWAWDHMNEPRWVTGRDIPAFFSEIGRKLGWENVALVGHNIKFDGSIAAWIYNTIPGQFIDTRGMSKAILGKTIKSHHLAQLAEHFGLEAKGVMKTAGIRDLTPQQEEELAMYCKHDVWLCREIYNRLAPQFPENQYAPLSRTIEMFVNPKLVLDVPLLQQTAEQETLRRVNIFKEIGIEKSVFASNVKFPKLLEERGFPVPYKPSPRKKDGEGNAVQIPALALGDPEFLELGQTENKELKGLIEARIAAKSTLLETRSSKLAAIGATGPWPFDVEFSGADQTHRFSGGSGAGGNPQNFTRKSALRYAVRAPEGYELVVGDFSNIELRLVAYLSKDPGLVQAIENHVDLYCDFASVFYGRRITKYDEKGEETAERRFGKCLAEGTLILCEAGWTRIEQVTKNDRVWDGETWVTHQGLVDNGLKEVTGLDGLWLTPDHPILCGTEWKEAQSVVPDENFRYRALARGSERLPLQAILKVPGTESSRYSGYAIAGDQNGMLISQTSKRVERLDVMSVPKNQLRPIASSTGVTPTFFQTMPTDPGFLTAYLLRLIDVIIKKAGHTNTMDKGEFLSTKNGEMTDGRFLDMYKRSRDGMYRSLRWIGRMLTEGMNPGMSALFPDTITYVINDELKTSKPKMRVYDLLSAGPRNRFTVLTGKGPIIVHNCSILGLGYGMGWEKFIKTVRVQTGQTITEEDARRAIDLYRTRYAGVPRLWETLDNLIEIMTDKLLVSKDVGLPVDLSYQKLWLPSNLTIKFPNLRQEKGSRGRPEWVYDVWDKGQLQQRKLYGGKLLENISQALAGELCKDSMKAMGDAVVGQVHDELLVVCKKGLGRLTAQKLKRVMSLSPSWLPQMQLEAEVGWGNSWGEIK